MCAEGSERRIPVYLFGAGVLALLLLGTLLPEQLDEGSTGQNTDDTDLPNIVILLADDAGWNDVGYHGSEIQTPNIDRLAREGVRLEQFYAYPTCSPARVALLAGRPPSRYGILGPIAGNSKLALPTETQTLADILRRQGYNTAIAGKWHLGLRPEVGPWNYGFDYSYGYLHGQIDPYTHRYKFGDVTWHRNSEFIQEEGHATDLIAREAIQYVRDNRNEDQPFFLYVSFSVPHYPLHEPANYIDIYRESIANRSRRRYAASMTHMDDAIGQIMSVLYDENLTQNTLVIFASDNGGQQAWMDPGEQYEGRYAPHDRLGDNYPLRGWKGDVYEGGIRVPAVAYWEGRLEPNVVNEPIAIYDLLPTLAHLTGATYTNSTQVEGENVWSAIEHGDALPERPLYWRERNAMALRYGDWKLVHQGESSQEGMSELYNLSDDPRETQNVADEHPDKLKHLKSMLTRQTGSDKAIESQ